MMKKKFKTTIICCLLLAKLPVQAEVLIKAPKVSLAVYQAVVETRPGYISLISHFETLSPSTQGVQTLTRYFEEGQRAFLSGNTSLAREAFREVTKLALEEDWEQTHRQVLFFSYLRLAQMSSLLTEQERFIESAINFAPEQKPDIKIFPPPLRELWSQTKEKLSRKTLTIDLRAKFASFEIVKVNGRSFHIAKEKTLRLFPGVKRISLLSNSRPYVTHKLNSTQLLSLKFETTALVYGGCDSPGLQDFKSLKLESASVLYEDDCIQAFTGTGWAKPSSLVIEQPAPAIATEWVETQPASSQKKTLIVIGLTALVFGSAYLIYKNNQKTNSSSSPSAAPPPSETASHTEGL